MSHYSKICPSTIDFDIHPHLAKVSKIWDDGTYIIMYDRISGYEHLRIRRKDDKPIHSYMDIQRIKNDLLGKDIVAIEIYPKQKNFVNGSNTYHLWTWDNIDEFAMPDLLTLYNYIKSK